MKRCILVVARDPGRRAALARMLVAAGYGVEVAEEAKRARELARSGDVALAVLAVDGLSTTGQDVVGQLHEAIGELAMVVERADDRPAEILGRIEAALQPRADRRAATPEVLCFDGWTLDVRARSLWRPDGREVPLTHSEFELLMAFVGNPGWVLSRDQLRTAVAGRGAEPYERSVDMLVGRLRRKIESDPKAPCLILTIPGAGYKFLAKPRLVDAKEHREGSYGWSAKPTPGLAHAETPAPQDRSRSAERRQVTVMSCEFVVSGPQSARLDPEDLRTAINACTLYCRETLARFGGTVVHHLGHRLLACFGFPQAHEDDAEQAVRAGLVLTDAIPHLKTGAGVESGARVGIATGIVVMGELVATHSGQAQRLLGEAPKLAEDLQALAEPGQVIVASSTRQLSGGLFHYRDLGSMAFKPSGERLQAAQVLGLSAVASRFEARHGSAPTPLVGREEELELLLRRWRQTVDGQGRVVLLTGEAGIGKSRLAVAVAERLEGEPHVNMRYFCSPYHQDSALYPTIAQLERAAGFEREDTPETKLNKLETRLAATWPSGEDAALLADLLSIPTSGRYPSLNLTPQRKKQKLFDAILRQFELLARQRPVLVIYEDLHWADPTSKELLDISVERVRQLPALLVISYRTGFKPHWIDQPQVTCLALSRLDSQDSAALVHRVAGAAALPEEVQKEIVERTDGVPLFIEELTRAVLETAAPEAGATAILSSARASELAVPATLNASLMARLDRLGAAAQEVAQIGATLGREFTYELLAAVADRSEAELRDALERLTDAGLLFRRGTPPEASYLFKHALVQDAAYGTLLRSKRQALHGRTVMALEDGFPEVVAQQPEILARHCSQAGLIERAVAYWSKAGAQSAARSAMAEAVVQLRKGLELLASLPESRERWCQELELQSGLGRALLASRGPGSIEAGEAYARARAICERLGDISALVPVLSGQSIYHFGRGELAAAREIADSLLRLGHEQSDAASQMVGHRITGICLHQAGRFGMAQDQLVRVLELYDPDAHRSMLSVAAFDPRAAALSYTSNGLLIRGFPDQALAWSEQALSWSRQLRNPHSVVYALFFAEVLHRLLRAEQKALTLLEEAIAVSIEQGFSYFLARANIVRGYVVALRGEPTAGLALAREGMDRYAATGTLWNQTYLLGLLAQSCSLAGRAGETLELLDSAVVLADRTGERWFEPELYRLKGEWCIAHRPKAQEEAEALFRRAIALAQTQDAKTWELRAATSLARLWRQQRRCSDARSLLASIYSWFTEGMETPDLKDAEALLDELQSPSAVIRDS
jgi:DNA-binding response OmpR family regulator/predicted ATPase/class 3 adenylate cyclase